jgi:tRNA threonylcarbamoyladenosine biosynthesis protein TsaB
MRILSIDTSTSLASVALVAGEKPLAESVFVADRCLSARLVPEILRLLEGAGLTIDDLDLFACAVGPGSFTGVRAGVATAQGFSLATGKPCAAYSSLTLLAMNFPLASLPVCSLLDARKNEVYAALFDCSTPIPTPLIHDCVLAPERFLDLLDDRVDGPVILCGDGTLRYQELISSRLGERARFAPFPQQNAHAINGALIALQQYRGGGTIRSEQLLPVYIRASEAEYAKLDQQKALRKRQ